MRNPIFWFIGCCLVVCLLLASNTGSCYEASDASAIAGGGKAETPEASLIDKRLAEERQTNDLAYILTPHRPNYLLPVTYNSSMNTRVYDGTGAENVNLDNVEVKFQLSVKYMLLDNLVNNNGDFYIAYTNLSYWQAYNSDISSPFRDTNHEPEAWFQWEINREIRGIRAKFMQFGIWHQSNGRAEPLSRSWNRLYSDIVFEKGDLAFGIKPWYRIPEDKADDNNPDIAKYFGYGELYVVYKKKGNTVSLMLRNNLRSTHNKGAIEIGWSFPLSRKLKGYIQYFNGYGQTILDYNHPGNTIGFGLALSDFL